MQDVSKDALDSAVQENITELLQSISDPRSGHKRQFVYQTKPFVKGDNFDGYPYILIEDYGFTSGEKTADSTGVQMDIHVAVSVFNTRESADDKSEFDSINDELKKLILTDQSIGNHRMASGSVDRDDRFPARDEADQPVLVKEVEFSYNAHVDFS